MGWSGGTFTRVHDWTDDEAGGIDILSTRFDEEDDNFEAGINACLTKDGSNSPSANLPMGGMRHTGAGAGTDLSDYTLVSQTQNGSFKYGVTAGSLNDYTLTLTPAPAAYATGQQFNFFANRSNSGATQLNVNSLGWKKIKVNGADCTGGEIVLNRIYTVIYDGTNFHLVSGGGGGGGGVSLGGAKICMLSEQSVTPSEWRTVNFRTEVYDDSSYYTAGADGFTIPATGRYRVSTGIYFNSPSPTELGDTYLTASFAVNGSTRKDMFTSVSVSYHFANSPHFVSPQFSHTWEGTLTAGDIVTLKIYHMNESTSDGARDICGVGTERDSSWLAIERIA